MSNVNVVIMTGNLTRDPDVNYAGQQVDRAKFGLAANRKWTDRQSGEAKQETCFVDCVAWKSTASVVSQYCKKGSKIGIVGELKLEQWTAQDGGNRSRLVVNVRQIELLDGPPQDAPGYHGHYGQGQGQAQSPPQGQRMMKEDEIPF